MTQTPTQTPEPVRPARIRIRQMPGETRPAFWDRIDTIQRRFQGKSILWDHKPRQTVCIYHGTVSTGRRCCACHVPLSLCECNGAADDLDPFEGPTDPRDPFSNDRTHNRTDAGYDDAEHDADGEYEAHVIADLEDGVNR